MAMNKSVGRMTLGMVVAATVMLPVTVFASGQEPGPSYVASAPAAGEGCLVMVRQGASGRFWPLLNAPEKGISSQLCWLKETQVTCST